MIFSSLLYIGYTFHYINCNNNYVDNSHNDITVHEYMRYSLNRKAGAYF